MLLSENLSHPSLRAKKVRSATDIWEASVTMSRRMTFQYAADGAIILRNCNGHEVLGRP